MAEKAPQTPLRPERSVEFKCFNGKCFLEYCDDGLRFSPEYGNTLQTSFDRSCQSDGYNLIMSKKSTKYWKVYPNDNCPCIVRADADENDPEKDPFMLFMIESHGDDLVSIRCKNNNYCHKKEDEPKKGYLVADAPTADNEAARMHMIKHSSA